MSNLIILFLNVLVFTIFFISLDAKIGSIQKKPKSVFTANSAKVSASSTDVGVGGDDAVVGRFDDNEDEADSEMLSDAKLAEQLDEIAEVLPLFANYLVVRALAVPRAAFSLSVKAAKDRVKYLSTTEKNRLFLQNCQPDVRAQLSSKLQYLTDQLSDRQIAGVAQKFTSLSAAKFLCNKMDHPKLARFVELLPKQKKEKGDELLAVSDQANTKSVDLPHTQRSKQSGKAAQNNSKATESLTTERLTPFSHKIIKVVDASQQIETDIHAKHIHQDTDIETGSGDL